MSKKVKAFWGWFSENAAAFGKEFENDLLLGELDTRVAELGTFGWELGPGLQAPNAFVLSPGGDRALLAQTEAILSTAPRLAGWEFHPAKPPKHWDLQFEILDEHGATVSLDASRWRYRLRGTRGVVVIGDELSRLGVGDAVAAAEIALDGILGERARLERFDEVLIDQEAGEGGTPITEVRAEV